MNTVGHKMNNKLTNVIGNKLAHKFHSMGHKMMPKHNMAIDYMKPMSNLISDNLHTNMGHMGLSKKIMNSIPKKINYKNKLTK